VAKPRIVDSRITVADVVIMYRYLRQSLEEIGGKYDLPLAAVYAAMTYYYDHQEEIDHGIRESQVFAENLRQHDPSRVQAKLQAVTHG
jgi:uncharacterized protein (DUF433 family)